MTKRVMQAVDGAHIELARFDLQPDGQVVAVYRDPDDRADFEDGTYVYTEDGALTPADGRRFFDAIDLVFARSSTCFVEVKG